MSLSCKKNENKEVTRKDIICEPGKHYEMIAKSFSPTLHINHNGFYELITDPVDRLVIYQKQIFLDYTFTNYINSLADVHFSPDGTYFYEDYGQYCCNIIDTIIQLFYHPYTCPQGTWTLTAGETT
jgi:hypothetical protein